jgi:hypothetical protein
MPYSPAPLRAAGAGHGRRQGARPRAALIHICATHSESSDEPAALAACAAGDGCVSVCGKDLSRARFAGEHLPASPDDCVVCHDLWGER